MCVLNTHFYAGCNFHHLNPGPMPASYFCAIWQARSDMQTKPWDLGCCAQDLDFQQKPSFTATVSGSTKSSPFETYMFQLCVALTLIQTTHWLFTFLHFTLHISQHTHVTVFGHDLVIDDYKWFAEVQARLDCISSTHWMLCFSVFILADLLSLKAEHWDMWFWKASTWSQETACRYLSCWCVHSIAQRSDLCWGFSATVLTTPTDPGHIQMTDRAKWLQGIPSL